MGSNMYFAKRDEILFIEYGEVIKSPTLFMLKLIKGPYKDIYKDFLWIETIEDMTDSELEIYLLRRTEKNIFRDLAKKKFDYDKALSDLYNKFDDMFIKCPLMKMGQSIDYLVSQKFNKKVYFYSKEYDPRIEIDLKASFADCTKIEYVFGDISDIMNRIEQPTVYILDNMWMIPELVYLKKTDLSDIICSRYRYNLKYNEELDEVEPIVLVESYLNESTFKFGLFSPLNLNATHGGHLEERIIKYSS